MSFHKVQLVRFRPEGFDPSAPPMTTASLGSEYIADLSTMCDRILVNPRTEAPVVLKTFIIKDKKGKGWAPVDLFDIDEEVYNG